MTRRVLVAIVGAALAIRLLHWLAIADTAFPRFAVAFTESDLHAFWAWAQRIVAGDWLGRDTYHPDFVWMREMASTETWERWWGGKEIFHQAPLYPYFVAVVAALSRASDPGPVLLTQLVLGAAQPLVLFALGRRLAGERAGLVAAALAALYAPFVFHQGVLLRDWLPPILEPLALLLLLRAADRQRARDWLLAGAAVGGALLTRETALLLLPVAGVWILLVWWGRWRAITVAALLVLAGFGAALAPLAARNAAVGAPLLSLSNRGGVTFVQHNAAPSSALWSEFDVALQKQILERTDGDGRAILLATLETYGGDSSAVARKLGRKLRGAADPIEIPSNVSFAYGREISPVLRLGIGFGIVFPLGVAGLLLSLRDPRRHLLLYGYLALSLATLAISLPLARYRLPLATIAILYAGLATVAALDAARARRWRSLAAVASLVAVAATLQQFVIAVPELRTSGWMAMYGAGVEHTTAALLYRDEGRPGRAAAELMRLRQRVNDDPWTLEIAREMMPIEASLRIDQAAQRIAHGALEEARAELALADRLESETREAGTPPNADALFQLATLHEQLGDVPKARVHFARFLEVEPTGPRADTARRSLGGATPRGGP